MAALADNYDGAGDYRARYYEPSTGRFISEDPITFSGGFNFYDYVLNSPTNLTDPRGLKGCVETPKGLVCWDDGKPSNTIFRPLPPANPIPNDISNAFNAFWKCVNNVTVKCWLPKPPSGGGPPTGANGDMGVLKHEGTLPVPEFSVPDACNCLKEHPLAALDPRFSWSVGNQTAGISPGCMVSIP